MKKYVHEPILVLVNEEKKSMRINAHPLQFQFYNCRLSLHKWR